MLECKTIENKFKKFPFEKPKYLTFWVKAGKRSLVETNRNFEMRFIWKNGLCLLQLEILEKMTKENHNTVKVRGFAQSKANSCLNPCQTKM